MTAPTDPRSVVQIWDWIFAEFRTTTRLADQYIDAGHPWAAMALLVQGAELAHHRFDNLAESRPVIAADGRRHIIRDVQSRLGLLMAEQGKVLASHGEDPEQW